MASRVMMWEPHRLAWVMALPVIIQTTQCSHTADPCGKLNMHLPCNLALLFLDIYPTEMQTHPQERFDEHIYNSFLQNSPKQKTKVNCQKPGRNREVLNNNNNNNNNAPPTLKKENLFHSKMSIVKEKTSVMSQSTW